MMGYKGWVIVAISLFAIGVAFGLATPASIGAPVSEDLLEQFSRLLAPFSFLTAVFIFLKNVLYSSDGLQERYLRTRIKQP